MKVSVITVCYNASKTIENALRSVQAQAYGDIEKIVVDGGSSDGTQDIVKRYLSSGDKYVSEKDGGIYDAMNKGVAMATGDVIYFLNADDALIDGQILSDIVSAFAVDLCRDLVYGKVLRDSPPGGIMKYSDGIQFRSVNDFLNYTICHQSVFVKRDLFIKLGGFDLQYRFAADREWLVRAYKNNPAGFVYLDRVIASYYYLGLSYQQKKKTAQEFGRIIYRHFPFFIFLKYWIRYVLIRGLKKQILNEAW